jgi:diguanylate cyclase (GGDEF)-like protein
MSSFLRRRAGLATVVCGGLLLVGGGSASALTATPALPPLPVALPTVSASVPPLPVATPTPALPPLPLATPSPTLPPLPLATPSPTLPPLPVATPSPTLPVVPTGAPPAQTPAPSSPPPTPTPSAVPPGGGGARGGPAGGGPAGGSGSDGGGPLNLPLAILALIPEAAGVALIVALATLPLLAGVLLLLLGRLLVEARRMRDSRMRLTLAAELELRPRELAQLSRASLLKLRDQVAFDDLTGVMRRVAGVASVEREIARAQRSRTPLTVAFVDVDGLKVVNDTRGHAAGDDLLVAVATLLQESVRKQDLIFRYGGDEFVCVLPGMEVDEADDKLRDVRATAVKGSTPFSFGLTDLRPHDDLVSFLARADEALYHSKSKRAQELGGELKLLPGALSTPPPARKRRPGPRSAN